MDERIKQKTDPAPEPRETTTRRDFMTVSGALLAGATLAGCTTAGGGSSSAALKVKPMTAQSYGRVLGANDRIRIGVIGTGGMGTGHVRQLMHESVVQECNCTVSAVCDIYRPRLERAQEFCQGRAFHDYQDLLASGLVDGVVVAAPEHWHCRMSLDALACGLDVYCQKPMTRTYEEARQMYHAFKSSDRIFQLGTQYMQVPIYWRAREIYQQLLAEKKLEKRILVTTGYSRNSREGEWNYRIDENARVGENLDWRAFLGPVPYEPYKPEYFFQWRKYKQFSAGPISDLLPHKLHSICYVMGEPDLPLAASTMGGIYAHPDRTVPDTTLVSIDYGSYVTMLFSSTANANSVDTMIRCHEGDLLMDLGRGTIEVTPQRPYASREFRQFKEETPAPTRDAHVIHLAEFMQSMRTRKQPTWSIEPSYRVMAAIALAQDSYLLGRTVYLRGEKLA